MLPSITRRVVTYGLDQPADVAASEVVLKPFASTSRIWLRRPDRALAGSLHLAVPGRHNVANALAAIAVGLELQIPFERIAAALAEFEGAERRFERLGEARGVLVVDDYGHHPTEIAAVIAAARTLQRRLVVVFQPHRYTRTAQLLHEFGPALAGADEIVLTGIYSAGEKPLPGATLEALVESVRRSASGPVHVVPAADDLPSRVAAIARQGDVVVTLGAGSIGAVGRRILKELEP
jgi:UDP-N-acetylmuramate--alanine ligase